MKKLLSAGLIKEVDEGTRFVVDRIVFENMIRIKTSLVPIRVSYIVFFGVALVLLLTLLRPESMDRAYVFSIVIMVLATAIFVFHASRTYNRTI